MREKNWFLEVNRSNSKMNKMLDSIDTVLNLVRQIKEDLADKKYYQEPDEVVDQEDRLIYSLFIDCNRYKYYTNLAFKKHVLFSLDNLYLMYISYLYTFINKGAHVVGKIKQKNNPVTLFYAFLRTNKFFYFINNENIISKKLFKGLIAASIKNSKLKTRPVKYYTVDESFIISESEQFTINLEDDLSLFQKRYNEYKNELKWPATRGEYCFNKCPYKKLCFEDRNDFMLEDSYTVERAAKIQKKEKAKPIKQEKKKKKKITRKGKSYEYKNGIIVDL